MCNRRGLEFFIGLKLRIRFVKFKDRLDRQLNPVVKCTYILTEEIINSYGLGIKFKSGISEVN
jgi:hypothetical protein